MGMIEIPSLPRACFIYIYIYTPRDRSGSIINEALITTAGPRL